MRYLRLALILAGAVMASACFQFSTVISLKPDGSGTIDQRMLFTRAAVAQLQQLAALGGGAQDFDPLSEQQARDAAPTLGPGVTYLSSAPIDNAEGVGRQIKYAFTDINTVSLDQTPPPPGGAPGQESGQRVSFTLTHPPNGNALLTIRVPQLPAVGGGTPQAPGTPSAAQLAMVKPLLAGARISIAIEPAGRLVRTSSPYVSGQRVILLDLDVDALLNEATLERLQAAKTPEEAKAVLKSVPGVKANLDPELTIEFQ